MGKEGRPTSRGTDSVGGEYFAVERSAYVQHTLAEIVVDSLDDAKPGAIVLERIYLAPRDVAQLPGTVKISVRGAPRRKREHRAEQQQAN
jgi:hypothetical protein